MSFERIRRKIGLAGGNNLANDPTKVVSHPLFRKPITTEDLGPYSHFVNKHKGEGFIVCGCGVSINDFVPDEKSILFGVNDINRKIETKYLLCVNEAHTFKRGRYQYVENNTSETLFTHIKGLSIRRPETAVIIQLGTQNGVAIDNIGKIDFTANSPYMAAIIAYQMGASKIALVGVDLTNHHFFENTGKHILSDKSSTVNEEYKRLGEAFTAAGVKIANLSEVSLITSWPYMSHEEFLKL